MDKAYQHLRRHKVRHASTGPQTLPTWNANAGGIRAFYFKDPDGHFLEVIWFPHGKGDARWQAKSDRLFLGIDHTAITVADTDTSLAFWRDRLGLQPVGGSENYGPEQEHLNNVFGALLKITTLRAARGPGVELLEYLSPSGGRPAPGDAKCNDIWNWYVRLEFENGSQLHDQLGRQHANLISSQAVDVPDPVLNYGSAFMARDPDGHAVLSTTPR
jgi:catechol 2,3-dioxygenase-like lactoylglutathione lyase family enzyme